MDEFHKERRFVRVGFLRPREQDMHDDTIYVSLRKHGFEIGARAVSGVEFGYLTKNQVGLLEIKPRQKFVNMINYPEKIVPGNQRSSLRYRGDHYQEFIDNLVQTNNGIVIDRRLEDGLEILRRFEGDTRPEDSEALYI